MIKNLLISIKVKSFQKLKTLSKKVKKLNQWFPELLIISKFSNNFVKTVLYNKFYLKKWIIVLYKNKGFNKNPQF